MRLDAAITAMAMHTLLRNRSDDLVITVEGARPHREPAPLPPPAILISRDPPVPNPHDLERIRRAELKRARKATRLKGPAND